MTQNKIFQSDIPSSVLTWKEGAMRKCDPDADTPRPLVSPDDISSTTPKTRSVRVRTDGRNESESRWWGAACI